MSKRAIILAGGKGTRLKPYTISLPKPLVPIGEQPILEIILKQLASNGFTHVTIALNHFANIIKAYVGDGSHFGMKIDFSTELEPLNTMGPLSLIKDLPTNFLIMNGDVLTNLNYADFYEYHVKNNNLFTISSFSREIETNYGVLNIDQSSSNLLSFQEKPKFSYLVSMGVYMANKAVLTYIARNKSYGFDDLMYDLLKNKKNVNTKQHDGYWLDIGRPADYEKAIIDHEIKF